jgi:hypothetical protein
VRKRIKAIRWLAYTFGVLAPFGDTVRRWSTWREFPPAGRALLAAAWGFTCALGYCSVFLHWLAMQAGEVDPAPIPTQWVFAIKVLGTLLAVLALTFTLVDTPAAAPDTTPGTVAQRDAAP